MTERVYTFEAKGEFPFTFYIEKAVAEKDSEEMILEGVASTINLDHDNERMSKEALHAMARIINEKSVPLRVEHSKSENAIIGDVFKASVDERNQLHIKCRLDKSHPVSPMLYHSIKELGKKMGFSVGGLIKSAVREFSESAGKLVKTFYDVELKEVSVTPRPANYDSWAIAKSIADNETDIEKSRRVFYEQFLFDNPTLDYLQVFAKAIPDSEWKKAEKLEKTNKTSMADKNTEKTGSETETEKSVSRQEFGVVVKGIESLAKAFESFVTKFGGDSALDQRQPEQKKPEDESPDAKKAQVQKDGAKDQSHPDEKKPDDESPTAKKSEADGTDENGEREKSEKDEETEKGEGDKEDTEKGGKGAKKSEDTDTYDMQTVERSIATIEAITKKISGMKKSEDTEEKEKSEKEDETEKAEETETEKGMHPLDQFVVAVTKAMEAVSENMAKSGKHILGFEKSIVETIRNDAELQGEIAKMMKIPGAKQSVAMGVPYMVTKEGRRFAITAQEAGGTTVEKSQKSGEKKSFKDVYKTEFSSIKTEE